ncbi:MAG: universal stress protein UspA [Deltaproteobacteria bacterium]|nr:MAG: universal stress protein UspA [Deltaproteobacteria bacterium]
MSPRFFHIYRNTPLGRENLLQSLYFCKMLKCDPIVYIPQFTKFLIYFDREAVQVDLDRSYLSFPESAKSNASMIIEEAGFKPEFFIPEEKTATNLPDVTKDFDYMCCPRTISEYYSKIGLGHIGMKVRKIVNSASFPVLIPGAVFKPWNSVTVFFGGSANSLNALRLGLTMSLNSGKDLRVVTFQEKDKSKDYYRQILEDKGLLTIGSQKFSSWDFYPEELLEQSLFNIAHDSILVLGAYGHGIIKEVIFGSVMEKIQSIMPNNMLIAGPNYFMS